MSLESVRLIKVAFGELEVSDDETRQIFQVLLPAEKLPPSDFGLPVVVDIRIQMACEGTLALSKPYEKPEITEHASIKQVTGSHPGGGPHYWYPT